jgi:preprotein translocase subunit SecE
VAEFISGLFHATQYKRRQGRTARQATLAVLAIAVVLGAWRLSEYASTDIGRYYAPLGVLIVGLWISFRIVNMPSFADFLISVEAEMNKVSWPSRGELYRASMVVIVVIFFLAALLFAYDIVLKAILGGFFGLGGS